MKKFTVVQKDLQTKARLGKIETIHGNFETPVFMPVGTKGSVKTLTPQNLLDIHAKIILGNTYHLLLRPGLDIIKKAGGLGRFINWPGSLLTDSGGFQVFSLQSLNKITDHGVHFQSHIDGSKHFIGPIESMNIQKILSADIVMAFDECSPFPCTKQQAEKALERTHKWAKVCRSFSLNSHQSLFGIVQGSAFTDLRHQSAQEITALNFDGYAIGGLSVGEPAETMYQMIEETEPHLPSEKPRYLMGVGTPRNIIEAVMRGIDMFDCVMPTRNARNGTIFTWQGKISIKAEKYKEDFTPLDPLTPCYTQQFSKAYLRHLFNVGEITGLTLLSLQNLAFYLSFMQKLRQAIQENKLLEFYQKVCEIYPK